MIKFSENIFFSYHMHIYWVIQKFLNILLQSRMQRGYHLTEAIKAIADTYCVWDYCCSLYYETIWLLDNVSDFKVVKLNGWRYGIREFIFYKFEETHKATKATKKFCWAKVYKYGNQNFLSRRINLDDQASSCGQKIDF